MNPAIRRIVTEHDSDGKSVVRSDDLLTPKPIPSGDADFALIWTTQSVPADNNTDCVGADRPAGVTLHGGSVIRIVDMLPGGSSPMHRSHSIDYGIIISGQLELDLDGGETVKLSPGDIVVQRGTNHLWRNPSSTEPCRIVFILIEAKPVVINGVEIPESSH
jgi:quercetin dioxygenase-like cupin family protein